jgi:hypothetical protein
MADNRPTIRMVVFSLLSDLKQVYANADITPFKVFYWVMTVADQLRSQHIAKDNGGAFTERFIVDVLVDPVSGRNYFELPKAIYDYKDDGGIDYMSYAPEVDLSLPAWSSSVFTHTTVGAAMRLYFRDEERPQPSNPYYYRTGSRVYLLGVEEINLKNVEVGLKTSLGPADLTIDIDTPLDLPSHLLPILEKRILDLGRFVMMVPTDKLNDGSGWEQKNMPTQKISSVNEDQPQQQYNQPQ